MNYLARLLIKGVGFSTPMYQEVGKWLKGVFPVSTGIVVAGLAKTEWLMEIDVIAVIPE